MMEQLTLRRGRGKAIDWETYEPKIARLKSMGMTTKDAAEIVGIAPDTAQKHLRVRETVKRDEKKPTLQTLTGDLIRLAEAVEIDPETGETAGMDELEAAQAAFEDKAAAVAVAIRGAEAYAEGMRQYEADLKKRRQAAEAKIERLKAYLAENMDAAGIKRLDRVEARITLRESEAVKITDEALVPVEYKRIKWEVSKTAIKKALDGGQVIDGAEIEHHKNVVIS